MKAAKQYPVIVRKQIVRIARPGTLGNLPIGSLGEVVDLGVGEKSRVWYAVRFLCTENPHGYMDLTMWDGDIRPLEGDEFGGGIFDIQLDAINEYKKSLDVPELEDFAKGCVVEAQHQRKRWGDEHDTTKEPEDWFWLIGYLCGKALQAQRAGDMKKFKHHLITGAAVLANWHARARKVPQ